VNTSTAGIDPAVIAVLRSVQVSRDRSYFTAGSEHHAVSSGENVASKLSDYIYRRFHCGMTELVGPLTKADLFAQGLYEQFTKVTPAQSMIVPAILAPGFDPSGTRHEVVIDGLHVRINDSQLLSDKNLLKAGETAHISCPPLRPFLSPGFLYYGRSSGPPPTVRWRLYFSVADTESALGLWPRLISLQAKLGLANTHAKVGGSPGMYPRRDAIVVYLPYWSEEWAEILVQETGCFVDQNELSGFVRAIHPGIGLAEEPIKAAMSAPLSFGQHRSHILANTLVQAADGTLDEKICTAHSLLIAARVNPQSIHQNLVQGEMQEEATL
jgi:hypothetical protein